MLLDLLHAFASISLKYELLQFLLVIVLHVIASFNYQSSRVLVPIRLVELLLSFIVANVREDIINIMFFGRSSEFFQGLLYHSQASMAVQLLKDI
jgi:hypothetical protein